MNQPHAPSLVRGVGGRAKRTARDVLDRARRRPRAVYAEVLDGDALSLFVSNIALPGFDVALRSRSSGEVVALEFTRAESGPGECAGVVDLLPHAQRLAADPSGHELVLVPPARPRSAVPVMWRGQRPPSPIRVGATSDDRWVFRLERRGEIVVRADEVERLPRVEALVVEGDELVIRFSSPFPPEAVLLTDNEGSSLLEIPVEVETDAFTTRLADGQVRVGEGEVALVRIAGPEGGLPLVRTYTDIRDPGGAVVLPRLTGDPSLGAAAFTASYRRDGQLMVRRIGAPRESTLS